MSKTTKYVLHLHNAFRAGKHFDFRMKYLNQRMLISFAIPKERLPFHPGERVIAIQTPDHGMGWLYREKLQIPRGQYGGGFIQRMQYGDCLIHAWTDRYLKFDVGEEGEYLKGEYYMVLTRYKKTDKNPIWILGKKKEDERVVRNLLPDEITTLKRFSLNNIVKGDVI